MQTKHNLNINILVFFWPSAQKTFLGMNSKLGHSKLLAMYDMLCLPSMLHRTSYLK